jgi:integrase
MRDHHVEVVWSTGIGSKRKKEGSPAGLSGARARNVWSVLTSVMKEAATSKRRDLRVRTDNPCTTVQPPDKTDARAKTFVYPSEFLELMACEAVPRAWRELYAVACYLYLRPGELRALVWSDVDFAAGVVHVTKAYDEDSATVKAPKTRNGVRDVPIPATLVPLLKMMHDRDDAPGGAVVPLMGTVSERRRAGHMRKHFVAAKIDRARLTEQSSTTMQINFRSWRDTGITWLALQGTTLAKMQRRAGHERIETTSGYVKAAEDFTGSIGDPFSPLPACLVACEPRVTCEPSRRVSIRNLAAFRSRSAERAGFEPAVRF